MGRLNKKDKELLITDLCARIPHGVMVQEKREQCAVSIPILDCGVFYILAHPDKVRPYLRPISAMTDKEMDKLFDILHVNKEGNGEDWIKINDATGIKFFLPTGRWAEELAEAYRYLDSIHIDYRGLIPKKLAVEAPEDMYEKTK